MPRAPIDVLPQRELTLELKTAIDQARHTPEMTTSWSMAVKRLSELLLENPNASTRAHVLHNLGSTRRRWLCQFSVRVPSNPAAEIMRGMCYSRQGVKSL